MDNSSAFDNSIRREGQSALHTELLRRLEQHGIALDTHNASDGTLADLLSAVEGFEMAVADAGGDLFIDSPNSSEPERLDFVIPQPAADDTVESYIKRITDATNRISSHQ